MVFSPTMNIYVRPLSLTLSQKRGEGFADLISSCKTPRPSFNYPLLCYYICMFNAECYEKISGIVRGDIENIENLLASVVPLDNMLCKSIVDFLSSSSKRIRSVLALLYLRAGGFSINQEVYEILALTELIHNASLIHDDVIDNDLIRRNEQSLNAKYNNKMAVISGDYMLGIVMKKLTDLRKIELFEIFSKTINHMCEGEIIQYVNLNLIPSMDEYIEKTYKKTGALFESALVAANFAVSGEIDFNAAEFGKNFGIAFQINDDLKNVLDGAKDVKDGIYNAPVIFSGGKNVTEAGIEKTKILLNNYLENTRKYIENFENNVYKSKILELLELFNGYRVD